MSSQVFIHFFLVEGKNLSEAAEKVKNFLEKYELVRYDSFKIEENGSFSAKDKNFGDLLDIALSKNQDTLKSYISDLKREGSIINLDDVEKIPQGYLSKLFHLLAHLVDGFFGIDSYFYNLVEDSHWITSRLKKNIAQNPDNYFLIKVVAYLQEPTYYFEYLTPKKFFKK
ncbi:MAG: hypothetical protein ACK4Y7_00975 [Caldimicrobium sp.]